MEIPTFCFPFRGRIKRINPFTHILEGKAINDKKKQKNNYSLSEAEIRARLIGFPVYRFTDASLQRFTVINSINNKCQEFFFFCEEDCHEFAQGLVSDTEIHVITVPLAEVIWQERSKEGISLVPEVSEVINALEERKRYGIYDETFRGVPVFQSDILSSAVNGSSNKRSSNKRPIAFFRKNDIEKALDGLKGFDHDKRNIQVVAFEDIIQEMKDSATSKWNDVVFVPPGQMPKFLYAT